MTKQLLQWFLFAATFFAAGAPAVTGGSGGSSSNTGGGDAGTGAGSSGGTGGGGAPGGQGSSGGTSQGGGAGQGGQGGTGGQGGEGLPQLRQAYEGLKAKYEPFEKLNLSPDQISRNSGVYTKFFTEVSALGRELGYSDDDILGAFAEKPLETLDYLRHKYAEFEAQGGNQDQRGDLREAMTQEIARQIGPLQQRENLRMTNEANSLFERTVYQEATTLFKTAGIDIAQVPRDELEMILTATSEVMKYEEADVKALKFEGKTAGVQKAFKEAINALDKYYMARSGRERARLGPANRGNQAGQNQGGGQNGDKPLTLDQIINADPAAVSRMKSMQNG